MKRCTELKPANEWNAVAAIDRVMLDADERYRRRMLMVGERGTRFLLDLPCAVRLRDGDGLVLDDGSIVSVVGKAEPLVEVAAEGEPDRLRIAWHLGNRHAEVQVVGDRLRLRRDHVLEDMLRRLGASLAYVEAPFEPERVVYQHAHKHHEHEHHHDG